MPSIVLVHPGDIQDRDGAVSLLRKCRSRHPFVERAFTDRVYNSDRTAEATVIDIEIVRTIAGQIGFIDDPKRWAVERTFAWMGRNLRKTKDF